MEKENNEREIRLDNIKLDDFPDEILRDSPETVDHLRLISNKLEFIPESIATFRNLKGFHISENPIEFLPDSMFLLDRLKLVSFRDTNLTTIPDAIINLHNLEILVAVNNKIDYVSPMIFFLPKLHLINLTSNNIRGLYIPDEFSLHSRYIILGSNPISDEDSPDGLLGKKSLCSIPSFSIRFEKVDTETPTINSVKKFINSEAENSRKSLKSWLYFLFWILLSSVLIMGICTVALKRSEQKSKEAS